MTCANICVIFCDFIMESRQRDLFLLAYVEDERADAFEQVCDGVDVVFEGGMFVFLLDLDGFAGSGIDDFRLSEFEFDLIHVFPEDIQSQGCRMAQILYSQGSKNLS